MPKTADNKDVVVYEIWTSMKTGRKEEPFAPEGCIWVSMRHRPYYSTKKKAEKELESILSKRWAKPEDHYRIMECHIPRYMLEREISKGKTVL